jgi:potassium channel subfamily K
VITLLLLFHYIFQGKYGSDEESKRIRISGRHFMLSIISLISLLGLESLIFCMVEDWAYLDAICDYLFSTALSVLD